jgi:ribonuclease-3
MNDQDLREWLKQQLGVIPKDIGRYRMALTMRQCEVMELFGDAVLGFVISEYLVATYPIDEPGWFTHVRAAVVENKNLTRIGNKIGLATAAIVPSTSSKEQVTGKVVADMLEALIGAIYIDQGFKKCKEVIHKLFDIETQVLKIISVKDKEKLSNPQKAKQKIEERVKAEMLSLLEQPNPVSALQEFLAKKGESPPEYTEIGRTGEPHKPLFIVEATCKFRGRCIVAEGTGRSLNREARQNAAQNLLKKVIELYQNSWSTV